MCSPRGRSRRANVGHSDSATCCCGTPRVRTTMRAGPMTPSRCLAATIDRSSHRRADAQAFAESTAQLREHFAQLLPAFEDIAIARAWEGLFAMTPDGLPFIGPHRRYPRHLFALGYGGNGMTFGFLAARLLLDAVRGVKTRTWSSSPSTVYAGGGYEEARR